MSKFELPDRERGILESMHVVRPEDSIRRVYEKSADVLFGIESQFGTSRQRIRDLKKQYLIYTGTRIMTPGLPTVRAAGNPDDLGNYLLASCAIPPIDLREEHAEAVYRTYTRSGIGIGTDVSRYDNPVDYVLWIHDFTQTETRNKTHVGRLANMITLDIDHPHAMDFIELKTKRRDLSDLNISMIISDSFMDNLQKRNTKAVVLFDKVAQSAWECGDPGIIFMDRMNQDNPLADSHPYFSTPPCAEKAMEEGELCHFATINLANMVRNRKIDYPLLREVTSFSTRMLDNAVEYSIDRSSIDLSKNITKLKRPIAIGVSGLADMLIKLNLPYSSLEARQTVEDVFAVISYQATRTSVDLIMLENRLPSESTRYGLFNQTRENIAQIVERKLLQNPTEHVSIENVIQLVNDLKEYGIRNFPLTALPPTGTIALYLQSERQIEPFFNIYEENKIKKVIKEQISILYHDKPIIANYILRTAKKDGTFQHIPYLSEHIKELFKVATELTPEEHLKMLEVIVRKLYDSASKTVNLSSDATPEDIKRTILLAYASGLKAISVYVDKSKENQPEKL